MADKALTEYIQSLKAQGYSDERITVVLEGRGYPQSLIKAGLASATKRPTGGDPLRRYLKQYLAQGYDIHELRQYLISQGNTPARVDAAIARVTGPHFPVGIVIGVLILAVIIGAGLYGWGAMDWGEEAPINPTGVRLLDVTLMLGQSRAEPGDHLTPQIEVVNMGDAGRYDVHLKVSLVDEDGLTITSAEQTKAIATSFSTAKRFLIPPDTPPGYYRLRVVATYGGESPAIASEPIVIAKEEDLLPKPPEDDPEAPEPVPTGPSPEELVEKAVTSADLGDGQAASRYCREIEDVVRRDVCLGTIVIVLEEPRICEAIETDYRREECYLNFVIAGDRELCAKLEDPSNKNLCENLEFFDRIMEGDISHPDVKMLPDGVSPPPRDSWEAPDVNEYARPE